MIENVQSIMPVASRAHQGPIFDATGRLIREAEFNPAFFLRCAQHGHVLLVGEGNLSFACSLAQLPYVPRQRITASIYEDKPASAFVQENAGFLEKIGVPVHSSIDATKLDQHYKNKKFSTIIFQFPHTGSRDPLYGHNPNFILIRRFLKSAASCLEDQGRILITTVDNPHYRGAFQFEDAAKEAGYEEPETLSFEPSRFPGYTHTNTNDDNSAVDNHDEFRTWVFVRKREIK